ncbi:type II toxin-antitoxin system Phd/YefM family antitoxin [Lactiplantibacillus herbarum]|uniref:type II toxin-antitoxin system Phd/YefM family antitoxin n=1 Tax=Lactiplantibacillus herbarum TaxID=1670446 RepID=UPI0009E3B17D|nr:type II toxin-antitoxin system prevent-host-death family antitoxin [Lactiplantibacillus herbarum]
MRTTDTVTYSNFCKQLKIYMKQVNNDVGALIVTSGNSDESVVVMGKRDYDAMQETMRTLSNKSVMNKIRRGDQQFEEAALNTRVDT